MMFTNVCLEGHAGRIVAVSTSYIASYCVLGHGNVVRRFDHVDWMFHCEGRRPNDLFSATFQQLCAGRWHQAFERPMSDEEATVHHTFLVL